ncbi:MAG TPA: [Fe-Fe] hydrogenase large subunit C-terminal domain-containing protein [Polyangia bacterium]|jgi:signal transduction histidine kinase/Fe-S-cluster-containing hydrogenase component 2
MSLIVRTAPDQCRRCYSCVRRCPAKAIRVHEGQAQVIEERCLACGRCIKVCPRNAKKIVDNLPRAAALMAGGDAVVMLAPSFPAAFPEWRPLQLVAALRRAGFAAVHEVAFGAELVARAYERRYRDDPDRLTITTSCPAAVYYVEKYAAPLLPWLAPVFSPMAALGKALKVRLRPGCRTLFIGPCTAKIKEREDPQVAPWVDAVLTFPEVRLLLARHGVDPAACADEEFDPPRSRTGGIFPIPGGLARVASLPTDVLESRIHTTLGVDGFADAIEGLKLRVARGDLDQLEARFFDVLYCQGCTGGPLMNGEESLLKRKERVVAFVRGRPGRPGLEAWEDAMRALADLDLDRGFAADDQTGSAPSEAEIRQILARTGKIAPEDELNCRACGYRSCRDKAVAVHQGLAEVDMCLPYLVTKLEATVAKLHRSHEQLTEAQEQLIRSERLASMGQLAAGIAHEVNNPLGTVLIYAHLLLESAQGDDQLRADAEMIVHEANRCRSIVGGLLDFARQNKVQWGVVDVRELLDQTVTLARAQAAEAGAPVTFVVDAPADLPAASLDHDQMLQVLLNLVRNAIDVMPAGGTVTLAARHHADRAELSLTVSDTGPGIPPEHMKKLFSPFFTTKPVGRGTGLGLPICYGIVKMHRGGITARNNAPAPGATFEVRLPEEAVSCEP